MDTKSGRLSATEASKRLGTSVPRVIRAARQQGFSNEANHKRFSFDEAQVQALASVLGVRAAVDESLRFTNSELAVMAALLRVPEGLYSAREVATHAGVSPTTAAKTVSALSQRGVLVRDAPRRVASGRNRMVRTVRLNLADARVKDAAGALRRITAPVRTPSRSVPFRLRHLFWNTHPDQLKLPAGGPYIARRLLRTMDVSALRWGAQNLRASDWSEAAKARGLDPATRALALNLAGPGGDHDE